MPLTVLVDREDRIAISHAGDVSLQEIRGMPKEQFERMVENWRKNANAN